MVLKPITADVIRAVHRNLKEFGYNNLTHADVQAEIDRLTSGQEAMGIIGMFARKMLEENGYLQAR